MQLHYLCSVIPSGRLIPVLRVTVKFTIKLVLLFVTPRRPPHHIEHRLFGSQRRVSGVSAGVRAGGGGRGARGRRHRAVVLRVERVQDLGQDGGDREGARGVSRSWQRRHSQRRRRTLTKWWGSTVRGCSMTATCGCGAPFCSRLLLRAGRFDRTGHLELPLAIRDHLEQRLDLVRREVVALRRLLDQIHLRRRRTPGCPAPAVMTCVYRARASRGAGACEWRGAWATRGHSARGIAGETLSKSERATHALSGNRKRNKQQPW